MVSELPTPPGGTDLHVGNGERDGVLQTKGDAINCEGSVEWEKETYLVICHAQLLLQARNTRIRNV